MNKAKLYMFDDKTVDEIDALFDGLFERGNPLLETVIESLDKPRYSADDFFEAVLLRASGYRAQYYAAGFVDSAMAIAKEWGLEDRIGILRHIDG